MKRLWIMLIITLVSMSAGCRNGIVEPPETPTIPDYEIIVDIPEGKEGIIMALQSLSELGGGTLTLSEGVFVIDAPIRLISNMILQGQGENTVIKLADGLNSDIKMITGDGVSNVIVRDLVVDGNKTKQASGEQLGIFFTNSSNITVENVTVKNCRNQGLTFGVNTDSCVGNKIKSFNNNYGVVLTSSAAIMNSFIYSNTDGILAPSSNNVSIAYNFIYQNSRMGVWVESGEKVSIVGNKCYNNGWDGFDLRILSNSAVQNNEIYLNGRSGAVLTGYEGTPFINNNFSGNILYANNQEDSSHDNLRLFNECVNNTIQQNIIRVGDQQNKPRYGIHIILSTNLRNLITNNDLYQSGTVAAIRNGGTDTNFGAGNRVNDGRWIVGADYTP